MGEALANLLPWKDRNHALRYLSFLPLSHVVEGILAAYAPYYLLARVDYYYLNDFNSLSESGKRGLPQKRARTNGRWAQSCEKAFCEKPESTVVGS